MPRRNRVDPFGRIMAHPARGLLMGNRGCLHDDAGRIVRESARPAWISCLPVWPGVRRQLMQPGRYTELFFLDEPTALAAGHRPCGQCRPDALAAFKQAWARAHDLGASPSVREIDAGLRNTSGREERSSDVLPDGAMAAIAGAPFLRWRGHWQPWHAAGYGSPTPPAALPAGSAALLTPPAMLAVLAAGYRPMAHPSAC